MVSTMLGPRAKMVRKPHCLCPLGAYCVLADKQSNHALNLCMYRLSEVEGSLRAAREETAWTGCGRGRPEELTPKEQRGWDLEEAFLGEGTVLRRESDVLDELKGQRTQHSKRKDSVTI